MQGAVPLAIIGIAFGTFWMSVYIYLVYLAGRKFANAYRLKLKLIPAAILFGLFGALVAQPICWTQMPILFKIVVVFAVWLIHAQPLFLGYWSGVEKGRQEDEERWKSNADEWLNDLEGAQAPAWMRDLDEPTR